MRTLHRTHNRTAAATRFLLLAVIIATGSLTFQCDDEPATPEKKSVLASVTHYLQIGQSGFKASDMVEYQYIGSELTEADYYVYNAISEAFEQTETAFYEYEDGRVKTIRHQKGTALEITTHTYSDGRITRILLDGGIDTDASFEYLGDGSIKAIYTMSNGKAFTSLYTFSNGNVVRKETFTEPPSITTLEFDNGLNPYSLLGYTDPFLNHVSKNNIIAIREENGPTIPEYVPSSYEYVYNIDNFPVEQIIHFQYSGTEFSVSMKTVFAYTTID